MPKEVLKITNFGAGLNNNADPSSLEDNELMEATNVELSQKGTIKMPGNAKATVQAVVTTTPSAGIGSNGTIAGWASDHSIQTDLIYIPVTEGNILDFVGKWAFNNAAAGSATGMGRVVLVKENITYNATTLDQLYITNEHTTVGAIPSVWAAADDIWYADDAAGTGITQYGTNPSCISAVEPGPGVPESNQWLAHLSTDGLVSLYNYNSDRFFKEVFDLGSGTSISGSASVQDQVLRLSDMTFESQYALSNQSKWWGYIRRDMFQYDTTGVGVTSESRWIAEDADLLSWGDIGCTIAMFNAGSANIDDADIGSSVGDKIVISYWKNKDESGLNAYEGGWNGTFQFASCPIFDEKQFGEIDELGTIDFVGHTFNISVSVSAGTTDPTSFLSPVNKWPGVGTTDNKRVTGMRIYFKSVATDDWYILKDIDFVHGDVGTRWDTLDTAAEVTFGRPDMTSFVIALNQASNNADEEYAITTTNCTTLYNLTVTNGWGNRQGFIRVHGFHYDPVYVSVPDLVSQNNSSLNIPVTNPVAGTYQCFAELIDENYQSIAITAALSLTFVAGSSGAPPSHGGYGGCCWVAMELWGQMDDRTHQARFYVINNNNWFTRLYKRYGMAWAKIVKRSRLIQAMVKPVWKYMSAQGKEFFNRPTGYPKAIRAIQDLRKKYPDMFEYYLIGSNARQEKVTHYYDVNIVPIGNDRHTFAIWEDVLKSLYYVQEDDQRYVNPSICPQFAFIKDYSGGDVYKHRDDEVDCYFYYDEKFPKNFVIENLEDEGDNTMGNLWHNRIPLIGDKWRARGLDRLPYTHREIV